ncbi:MAG: HAD family hydrolase [Oscillospiraceae bacterium]
MIIKGAVFDLDGTLLDSTGMWDELDGIYLRSLGKEPLEGLSERLHPLTLLQAAELIQSEYKLSQTPEEILTAILSLAENFYRYEAQLKSGAAELLERLCAAGIPMCVCTANTTELTKASLERLGVWRYFCGCVTCSQYGGKDSDAIFRAAAGCLGTNPGQTIVFEDSLHALTTAKNAGFLTAAVFDRAESRQEQLKATADVYLTSLDEFIF